MTRAEPGASATAERLRSRGFGPVVAPLLAIEPLAFDPAAADEVCAIAFTSTNGAELWVKGGGRTDLPAYAVGPASAEMARWYGFEEVRSGDGGVAELAGLISRERPEGLVLHVGAREPAGDLVGALTTSGVEARSLAIYAGRETDLAVIPATDAVLLHSPRAARAYARVAPGDPRLAACLSDAVAAPLRAVGFVHVASADCPTEEALLRLLT